MWTIGDVKIEGKAAFKANYWKCVAAAFILVLFTGGFVASSGTQSQASLEADLAELRQAVSSMPANRLLILLALIGSIVTTSFIIMTLLKIFVFNPLQVGCRGFFVENINSSTADLGIIKMGFGHYGNLFITLFLRDLLVFLWSLLCIIPGIVKSYSYMMVPYILYDDPDIPVMEALRRSQEMMKGYKFKAFMLDMSFLGWYILAALTCGLVDVLWAEPYRQSAVAAFYLRICAK